MLPLIAPTRRQNHSETKEAFMPFTSNNVKFPADSPAGSRSPDASGIDHPADRPPALGTLAPQASAQSLLELYQAAHGYDASYLAAKALAESAPFRAAQSAALRRPSASFGGSATLARVDPPSRSALSSNSLNLALVGPAKPVQPRQRCDDRASRQAACSLSTYRARQRRAGSDHPPRPGLFRRARRAGYA